MFLCLKDLWKDLVVFFIFEKQFNAADLFLTIYVLFFWFMNDHFALGSKNNINHLPPGKAWEVLHCLIT